MRSFNNDITLNEQPDFTEITIQFKKSEYSSTIWMYIIITMILVIVGVLAFISSILNQNFDDLLILSAWIFLVFFLSHLAYENILWLQKGKEVITILQDKIILQKIYPTNEFYGSTQNKTITIACKDLRRVYYSRYIPWRNSFPSKSKGNLHFQDQNQIYSFAINLNQQECTSIIRLIKRKIPSCETNV